ncbi:C-glycoside deglycosidase beta subunit domain-containing protein [Spirosoma areae]
MIVETDVENVVEDGKIVGVRFGARLPYYRGISLSLLEEISLTVDGAEIPRDDLRLTLHGNTYSLAELATKADDRWNMGEVAHIRFTRENGLSPGEHTLGLMMNLRIAYMPFPSIRKSEKTILI